MARRTTPIQIGERSFTVGRLTLGTVRRVPQAFELASQFKGGRMPSGDEFSAMLALLWDVINAIDPTAITFEDFAKLVDDLDFIDGVKQLSAGITEILKQNTALELPAAAGNSSSSESAT